MSKNKKADKDTFILRRDYYPQIKLLSREQRGDLLTAFFAYAYDEELPPMDGATGMSFEFIRASIDFYTGKYNDRCKQNEENGKKGGRPRLKPDGSNDNQQEPKEIDGLLIEPNESEKTEDYAKEPEITDRFSAEPTEHTKTVWFNNKPEEPKETDGLLGEPNESEKNHEYDCDIDCDYESENTHTVRTETEGGAGETIAPKINPDFAIGLLAWVEANVPTVADMTEPFTNQHFVWLLRKYSVEDIKRIILDMHNKHAYKNNSAYVTFTNFARHDNQLKAAKAAESSALSGPKPYTWNEVVACLDQNRGKVTTDDFSRQIVDGHPVWFKKTDLQSPKQAQA